MKFIKFTAGSVPKPRLSFRPHTIPLTTVVVNRRVDLHKTIRLAWRKQIAWNSCKQNWRNVQESNLGCRYCGGITCPVCICDGTSVCVCTPWSARPYEDQQHMMWQSNLRRCWKKVDVLKKQLRYPRTQTLLGSSRNTRNVAWRP